MDQSSLDLSAVERSHQIRKVLWLIFIANVIVAGIKLFYGFWTGVLSVRADGFHSLTDSSSNIVGLIGVFLSAKPMDPEHPYGHRKFEVIGAWVIGVAILMVALRMLWEVVTLKDYVLERPVNIEGIVILFGTLIINIVVTRWEAKRAKELSSPLLSADSKHTLSDVYATIGVLISIIAIRNGVLFLDRIITVLIVILILHMAWDVLRVGVDVLLDRSRLDTQQVEKIAKTISGVLDCHKVRSRGMEGDISLDFHILLDSQLTLEESHRITHEVENAIKKHFPDVKDIIIHTEPHTAGRENFPWEETPHR